jgi:Zn-dependent peptidase ImmA (M78 family)
MIDKKQIENVARKVLESTKLSKIPVDPIEIANNLNIKVQNAVFNDESLSGMIAKREDNTIILVNLNDSPFRKRFTIAHELGHYIMHIKETGEFVDHDIDLFRGEEQLTSEYSNARKEEIEANIFASALLMDEEQVKKEWESYKDISKLAESFQVSRTAMGIRTGSLGLE